MTQGRDAPNPYAAPGTVATNLEDEVAATVPPTLARVAGGAIALAGGVVGLTGVQTLMIVNMRGPIAYAPYVLLGLALPHLALGIMVFRARAWAALASIGGTLLLSLASAVWLVFSISHFLFSLYALASPLVSVAALVFAILGLAPCQRASLARARLKAQGMDLGI